MSDMTSTIRVHPYDMHVMLQGIDEFQAPTFMNDGTIIIDSISYTQDSTVEPKTILGKYMMDEYDRYIEESTRRLAS